MSKAGLISDANGDRTPEQYFFEKIDYNAIIKNITFQKNGQMEPLYIKKPNIC